VFSGDPVDDRDQDHLPALLEHVLGTSDAIPNPPSSSLTWSIDSSGETELRVIRNLAAEDAVLTVESSNDLVGWQELPVPPTLETHLAGGLASFLWQVPPPQAIQRYFRLRAALP
jgi:hypothetical protein